LRIRLGDLIYPNFVDQARLGRADDIDCLNLRGCAAGDPD
jgi:hypothetical protein